MSTPDDNDTVLGPGTDIAVDPEDLRDDAEQTRDAEATPEENDDATETGDSGGTEGAGGAG